MKLTFCKLAVDLDDEEDHDDDDDEGNTMGASGKKSKVLFIVILSCVHPTQCIW
jgi:hypothetical protein